jgi:hypothetical protein
MTTFARYIWVALGTFSTIAIPVACAYSSGPETSLQEPEARDGASTATADATADVDATSLDAGLNACSSSGICITPIPLDNTAPTVSLTSVWGSSRSDVYAVGTAATVVHYDGVRWEAAAPTVRPYNLVDGLTLRSVWLERPDDVWMTEGFTIRHTSGWKGPTETKWEFVPTYNNYNLATIRGMGGVIWVAYGYLIPDIAANSYTEPLHAYTAWDGGPAAEIGKPRLSAFAPTAIAVVAPGEAWAVGAKSRVFRIFATTATDAGTPVFGTPEEYDSYSKRKLLGVWANERAVWLVGEGGTLRRRTTNATATKRFEIVESPVAEDLYGVFGFSEDDVWAVGEASTVIHWDGTSWTKLSTPFDGAAEKPRLYAVWGSSPTDIWIAGQGTMLHFQGNNP